MIWIVVFFLSGLCFLFTAHRKYYVDRLATCCTCLCESPKVNRHLWGSAGSTSSIPQPPTKVRVLNECGVCNVFIFTSLWSLFNIVLSNRVTVFGTTCTVLEMMFVSMHRQTLYLFCTKRNYWNVFFILLLFYLIVGLVEDPFGFKMFISCCDGHGGVGVTISLQ